MNHEILGAVEPQLIEFNHEETKSTKKKKNR